jgi:predicted Zn-dependent peptidase
MPTGEEPWGVVMTASTAKAVGALASLASLGSLSSLATLAVVAALAAAAVPLEAQLSRGERLPVREVTLDNGLRVLLLPREGAPTVSFVMHFRVGGVNEHIGTTGIAHLLEHMLFKGTESIGSTDPEAERPLFARMDAAHDSLLAARAADDDERARALADRIEGLEDDARMFVVPNELDRILTRAGARGLNATTSSEATMYYVELPANRAELFFALEADRMSNPVFREFYSERDVVTEERRQRVDTSPGGLLYETHLGAAFLMHPYGVPVVGYMSDLESLRRPDVEDYYRRFYSAGNAVLAVVGSFDVEQVERWAGRYLGALPTGERPDPILAVEPPQRGERRVEVEWDAQPQLRIGWHVPAAAHRDAPALAVLSAVLSGGRTSRLHRRLVTEDRTSTGVFTSLGPGTLYPQLFQIDATPRAPHTTAELEEAIYEEIVTLARDGPTADEVERVRNQIAAGAIRRMQSNLGLAIQLAESESLLGDWRETFRSSGRLTAVTPEDVRRVAARYFDAANRTVATLVTAEGT